MTTPGIILALVFSAAIVAVCWWRTRPTPPMQVLRCDFCDRPATIRHVEIVHDEDEASFGGGTAMVGDYCERHDPGA